MLERAGMAFLGQPVIYRHPIFKMTHYRILPFWQEIACESANAVDGLLTLSR